VGIQKLQEFGEPFTAAVRAHLALHPRQTFESVVAAQPSRAKTRGATRLNDTARETLRMFRSGMSPAEIATTRGFAETTIHGHLAVALFVGEQMDLRRILSIEEEKRIRALIEAEPAAHIARYRDKLGGNVGYGLIRLVLAATGQDPNR
jgi:uncharacterized protein YpbB